MEGAQSDRPSPQTADRPRPRDPDRWHLGNRRREPLRERGRFHVGLAADEAR